MDGGEEGQGRKIPKVLGAFRGDASFATHNFYNFFRY